MIISDRRSVRARGVRAGTGRAGVRRWRAGRARGRAARATRGVRWRARVARTPRPRSNCPLPSRSYPCVRPQLFAYRTTLHCKPELVVGTGGGQCSTATARVAFCGPDGQEGRGGTGANGVWVRVRAVHDDRTAAALVRGAHFPAHTRTHTHTTYCMNVSLDVVLYTQRK